mmetsp:Transcript_20103/g.35731  ORF Transcript_20103/g.35731 Transcript_20103/m.35731 type:complete len:394 (+) Transcript_20103:105-1286(+)
MERRSVESDYEEVATSEIASDAGSARHSEAGSRQSKRDSRSLQHVKSQAAEYLTIVLPYLMKMEELAEKGYKNAVPYVEKAREAYARFHKELQPYGPDEIMGMLTGMGMMFFGGFFITTIAVVEALNQGGREKLMQNLAKLRDQAAAVREANDLDDTLDDDGDGVADVDQISKSELTSRKFMVVVRSVDPNIVSDALGNLYGILMAVTATLQVKFARAISLGAGIGNVLSKTILKFIVPPLKEVVHADFHPWLPPVVQYICRFIGVSIAFSVQRVLSTVHTAMRGARLTTDSFTKWAEARNMGHLTEGYLDDGVAFLLAAIGVYGQLFVWSRLPILIKLLMFPATFTESILSMLVSASVSKGTSTSNQAGAFGGAAAGGAPMPATPMAAGIPT